MATNMIKNAYNKHDTTSLSNPSEAVSTHLSLDWTVDFDQKKISGSVTHRVKVVKEGALEVKFDTSKLEVTSVFVNDTPSSFSFGELVVNLGRALKVPVPESLRTEGSTFNVKITYSTSRTASAIQWLPASATSSKKWPFVFTQCQAIHARSMLPCQDSPGVKTTYTAVVKAPEWSVVLMSALQNEQSTSPRSGTFYWNQPVPTPAYLIALAAGELESREISKRVKVWAEPSVVDAAAFEFSQTEEYLTTAESLTCEYVWTRYDILCLPPSFPYGGMENPCLTFATPTLLAGDRSLSNVIAHEISHSWTGNLVTNSTWEHFWLNEGWTVWLERKIIARCQKNDATLKLAAQVGWKHLVDDVAHMGSTSPFTRLVWPLGAEDPDDAFSSVPYDKGFTLLYFLESLVGQENFEQFAKDYIKKFRFGTVTSGEFKDFFVSRFENNEKVKALDWDLILYSPGLPTYVVDYSNSLADSVNSLATKWISWIEEKKEPWGVNGADLEGWSTEQKNLFLEKLQIYQEKSVIPLSIIESLDLAYGFSSVNNSEIKFRWQMLCLKSEASWIVPHVITFITSQGRMKFVRPLYRALHNSVVGGLKARETFTKHNEMYHPIARKMVATDLGVELKEEAPAVDAPSAQPSTPKQPEQQIASKFTVNWNHVAVIGAVAAIALGVYFGKFKFGRR